MRECPARVQKGEAGLVRKIRMLRGGGDTPKDLGEDNMASLSPQLQPSLQDEIGLILRLSINSQP